ncbi:PAS domain-containing protein [Desulfopila sp. IMCC35006]|uniref:sigma-54 interaction domain-containing protein n=1 Tax=Desulfopila sp. IMCC35006 TaxID=2569542 RepID=UPI0010AB7043|nr:sigma 54-interacting transcriptional regulator [Desulfopila sp. IMCC35006]TKB25890.1 PAS domain-containing protein [Desulfopila sp. IMCC35006]
MKSARSPLGREAKKINPELNQQITPAFLAILDVILTSIHEPVLVLDAEFKVMRANHAFFRTFHVNADEVEGVTIYDLGNRQWDIPRLRELLENILPENSKFDNFELEHNFESLGHKILHLNAKWILSDNNQTQLIFLAIADVTELEYNRRGLEQLVEKRLVDLIEAKKEAESRKQIAETSLLEIKKLKDLLEAERAYLQDEIKLEYNHENILGKSDGLKQVLYKIEQISRSNTTVLILGETGTGKELVARALHGSSLRKNRALIKVNCATLPANLIESELFGHEKGAFTGSQTRHLGRFEVADGGTLFLDEIGELPLELQAKLLRVIQDGEFERLGSSHTIKVDTRLLAATNRNLEEEVRNGRFREDLWYRLNVFPITIPPLRDRPDDIPLLVDFYVKKIAKRIGKTIEIIPTGIMNALQDYHWPGNIRELENVLERAVINSSGPKLRLADELKKPVKERGASRKSLQTVEKEHILQILEQTKWKISGKDSAAEILGLDRSTLRARMRKLNIEK